MIREWFDTITREQGQRLVLAVGCGGVMALALVISCCGGASFLLLRPRRPVGAPLQVRTLAVDHSLSSDGKQLLVAAAADKKGRITFLSSKDGALTLHGGGRVFCKPEDGPRAAARWREAAEELMGAGLIEYANAGDIGGQYDYEHLRVTAAGFARADAQR